MPPSPKFSSGAARTVLVLLATNGAYDMRRQAGVQHVALARGWKLHVLSYSSSDDSSPRLRNTLTGDTMADLLEFWNPDGCIVECPQSITAPFPSRFGSIPTVFIASSSRPYAPGQISVCLDNASFGRVAANELFESGFNDYAFVPMPGGLRWSSERGREFKRLVKAAGKRCHAFVHPPGTVNTEHLVVRNITPWLGSLPKPVGVFAANDVSAECVLLGCENLGLAVPDEVAVIGVDDADFICENTRPTLSSIQQDFEGSGRAAAELLADMMDAPGASFGSRKYGAGRVVRRESTRFAKTRIRDERLSRAMEFIRQNACRRIGPKDVAKAMFVSRPMADDAFRRGMGSTILTEIHAVRLEKAREMLARGVRPDIVAQECGYGSVNDFRRVFKRRVGTTIRSWLRDNSRI